MKALVVDDHPVVRVGVRWLLEPIGGTKVLEATNGQDAIQSFRSEHPDVVLVDVSLPDMAGFELLRQLIAEDLEARVLMFSMNAEPLFAAAALSAGALGCISKAASPEEIVDAICSVANGIGYVERRLAQEMALLRIPRLSPQDAAQGLSTREIDLLRLLGEGHDLQEMADALGVSYKTVANSITLLKTKFRVSNTTQLIRISIGAGLAH